MNNYILLQHKCAQVELRAKRSKSQICTIKFGDGRSIEFDAYSEAEMCTLVYTDYLRQNWVTYLNDLFDNELAPDEIDDFGRKFRKAHPLIALDEYKLSDVPTNAENRRCELRSPYFKQPVIISLRDERDLLSIINTRYVNRNMWSGYGSSPNLLFAIQCFFAWHRERYGILAKNKQLQQTQDYELAFHFCISHGIDFNYVCQKKVRICGSEIMSGVGYLLLTMGIIGAVFFTAILILIGTCSLL